MELELKIPQSFEVGFVAGLQLAAAAVLVPHCLAAVPEAVPVQFLVAANASELKQAKHPIATRATAAARAKRAGIRSREQRNERLMGGSVPGERKGGPKRCDAALDDSPTKHIAYQTPLFQNIRLPRAPVRSDNTGVLFGKTYENLLGVGSTQ